MATYNPGSVSDLNSLDSIKKVQEYLIKQERKLDYMFNNLTPEENYSEQARLTMVTDGQRQATIETTLQGIQLNYVSKDGIVSAINLSEEMIQIEASKIRLEGMVTVNGYFKVGLDGSIEARNGKFSGSITGSDIALGGGDTGGDGNIKVYNSSGTLIGRWDKNGIYANGGELIVGNKFHVDTQGNLTASDGSFTGSINSGSTITGSIIYGGHIYGTYIGTTEDNFFVLDDGGDVSIGLGDGFQYEQKKLRTSWIGSINDPATGGDDAGINGNNGEAGFKKLYLLDTWYQGHDGTMWDVTRTLQWLDSRLSTVENECWQHCPDSDDGSDDCGSDGCPGDACMCEGSADEIGDNCS